VRLVSGRATLESCHAFSECQFLDQGRRVGGLGQVSLLISTKMPRSSKYQISIPAENVVSYVLPPNAEPSDEPIWIDAAEPERKHISPRQALLWCKRLAHGLQSHYGLRQGDVVLVLSQNHIFVPVAYLGVAGAGMIFSGCNPAYTARGQHSVPTILPPKHC
jgi:long-subunit acyl-CoA synthetase (AMP-forming)